MAQDEKHYDLGGDSCRAHGMAPTRMPGHAPRLADVVQGLSPNQPGSAMCRGAGTSVACKGSGVRERLMPALIVRLVAEQAPIQITERRNGDRQQTVLNVAVQSAC